MRVEKHFPPPPPAPPPTYSITGLARPQVMALINLLEWSNPMPGGTVEAMRDDLVKGLREALMWEKSR